MEGKETWVEGERMLKQCPDGSIIIFAERVGNKWQKTNVVCAK